MNENEMAKNLERIEQIGSALIAAYDDALRLTCPVCHFQNFEVHRVYKHIVFECMTPVPHQCEEGGPFCVAPCGFRYIVDPIPTFRLPELRVAEAPTPAKAVKKPSRPRRKRNGNTR